MTMANRSWFYATADKQQISCSEDQLRGLIAAGTITPDTLVWTEGMTGWLKAREIPDLHFGMPTPPAFPVSGAAPASTGAVGVPVRAEFGIWALLGRLLIYTIGMLLVIPAPWVATSFYRWLMPHLQVPQRPNLAFTGNPGDIWYVHILLGLLTYAGFFINTDYSFYVLIPVQAFLSWMAVRWIVGNISSNGQRLPFTFTGEAWQYVGWYLLFYVSFLTIIGWAWVITAWMRWICRNIGGTRRAVTFNASGWEVLWRTVVFSLVSALILPLPWALGWYARWYVSQFAVVERSAFGRATA
jgi:hypothetical protein